MGIFTESEPRPNPFNTGLAQAGQTFYQMMQKKYERDRIERLENEEKLGRPQLAELLRTNPALFAQLNPQQQQMYFAQNNQNRTFDREQERYDQNTGGFRDLFKTLYPDASAERIATQTPDSVKSFADYRKVTDRPLTAKEKGITKAAGNTSNDPAYNHDYTEINNWRSREREKIIATLPTSKFNDQIIPDFNSEAGKIALEKLVKLDQDFEILHGNLRENYGKPGYSHQQGLSNYTNANYSPGIDIEQQRKSITALYPPQQNRGMERNIPGSDVVFQSNGAEWVRISPQSDANFLQYRDAPPPTNAAEGQTPQQTQQQPSQAESQQAVQPAKSQQAQVSQASEQDLVAFSKSNPPNKHKGRYAYSKSLGLRLYSNGKQWVPVPIAKPKATT